MPTFLHPTKIKILAIFNTWSFEFESVVLLWKLFDIWMNSMEQSESKWHLEKPDNNTIMFRWFTTSHPSLHRLACWLFRPSLLYGNDIKFKLGIVPVIVHPLNDNFRSIFGSLTCHIMFKWLVHSDRYIYPAILLFERNYYWDRFHKGGLGTILEK